MTTGASAPVRRAVLRLAVGLVGCATTTAGAQPPDPQTRAFDLERRGQHGPAAQLYRQILAGRPGDLGALLGLERSLNSLGKLGDMVAEVGQALFVAERSAALYGVAVRVFTAAGRPDSARRAVDAWAALEPGLEAPYQEWGSAALAARDRALAKLAYQLGRERLGADALAAELAQLATIEGEYDTAVRQWMRAMARVSGYQAAAVSMLSQVPVAARPGVLRSLDALRTGPAERVAAALTIRWGDPVGGIRRIERALPLLAGEAVVALQDAIDDLRGERAREGHMARAIGLELLSARVPAQATRYRLESAQAYADAGDQQSARRMLSQLAGDRTSSPAVAASATSTLVTVLVAEGRLEEATRQFEQLKAALGEEERQQLAIRVADGWIRAGQLDRAGPVVAQDSTVDGLAVRGRIRLYQGDLTGAADLLRQAGPFAGPRSAAVSRATVLSLLQVIDEDSLPGLGAALLGLERRDSAAAGAELERVGAALPPDRGGAEVLLLAASVRVGLGDRSAAERVLRSVAAMAVPASAAQAELELGRLLVAREQRGPAIELLEHLLVTYPTSAVVPQARRLLDQAKGAVPPA
jgi:tetratricopeptide (TPR) repeat protein